VADYDRLAQPTSTLSPVSDCYQSRFLHGLSVSEAKAVLGAASRRRFLASSVVINQDDSANRLFLLVRGRARYFFITPEGQKIILFWLTPGDIFGGATLLLQPSCYLVNTEMVRDGVVLVWDRATIHDLLTRYPRLMENALSIAFDYFIWYRATHVALTCHGAKQRLAQLLMNLALSLGQKVVGGVALDVTNEELANAANVTTFTASRLLSEWQRNGVLMKSRGKIVLRSAERLLLRSL